VIQKRRSAVWTFFLATFLLVAVATFTATPIYRAGCDILIQRDTPGGMDFLSAEPRSRFAALEFYPTQYEIIRSAAVARRVVRDLDLAADPVFNPELRKESADLLHGLARGLRSLLGGTEESDAGALEDRLVEKLLEGLSVKPVKDSQVTRILFESESPELAANIANAVAAAYISLSLDMKMGASKETIQWLTRKIEEQRRKLDASETALRRYMEENDIVAIENRDTVTPRKIQEVTSQLLAAESKRRELEALAEQLEAGRDTPERLETVPVVMNDPIFRSLRSDEIELARKIDEMAKKYGPKHPEMIRLRTEQRTLAERKRDEIDRVITSVRNDLAFARAKEKTFRDLLEKTNAEAHALSEKSVQYDVLQREVLSNRQIYDALLKRVNEASITGDIRASNVTVIDRARPPRTPVRPRKALNLLLALVLGLFGGVGVAFFVEYLDNTLKTPEDVEERLGLPFLGLIPKFAPETGGNDIALLRESAGSPLAESYRAVRTAILLSRPHAGTNRVLLVTSAAAGEGKTTTAANLAAVIAGTGSRVLLIDADMRKPNLHRRFGLPNKKGLSSLLADLEDGAGPLPSGIENLEVLPSGPLPPNPSELLDRNRLAPLLDRIGGAYDRIVIDSPPILLVSDASILSTLADTIVLVVRAGSTSTDTVRRGIKQLYRGEETGLGVVLNAVDLRRSGYYGPYGQYAYGGYAEDGERTGD